MEEHCLLKDCLVEIAKSWYYREKDAHHSFNAFKIAKIREGEYYLYCLYCETGRYTHKHNYKKLWNKFTLKKIELHAQLWNKESKNWDTIQYPHVHV